MSRRSVIWIPAEDGWEVRLRRGVIIDYRKLMHDSGSPHYQGAAKRYAEITLMPDGRVSTKSSAGFVRFYDSIEEAKEKVR